MKVFFVFVGGSIGTICRFLVGQWMHSNSAFPLGTFTINLIGCFFLAWFLTYVANRMSIELILFIGTGFTGGFTTFSTFSVEAVRLLEGSQYMASFAYVVLSIVCGVFLSFLGFKTATFMKEIRGDIS